MWYTVIVIDLGQELWWYS